MDEQTVFVVDSDAGVCDAIKELGICHRTMVARRHHVVGKFEAGSGKDPIFRMVTRSRKGAEATLGAERARGGDVVPKHSRA